MTTTYTVRPKRWDHGYELHIEGLGVTQADDLSEAEAVSRDFIALDLDVPEDSFDVEIAPEPPESMALPAWVSLRDLEPWERHVWLTPQASVEEREVMIAIVRLRRGAGDLDADAVDGLWRALDAVRPKPKQQRSTG